MSNCFPKIRCCLVIRRNRPKCTRANLGWRTRLEMSGSMIRTCTNAYRATSAVHSNSCRCCWRKIHNKTAATSGGPEKAQKPLKTQNSSCIDRMGGPRRIWVNTKGKLLSNSLPILLHFGLILGVHDISFSNSCFAPFPAVSSKETFLTWTRLERFHSLKHEPVLQWNSAN